LDELDSSAPVAKRHRLSLDSRLVGLRESPLLHPALRQEQEPRSSPQPANRRASFSIDSIMNKSQGQPGRTSPPEAAPLVPVLPASDRPKISVPITPYSMRGMDPQLSLDPRVAHLAGVAANPHLGLSQIGYINPFYAQYLAMASQLSGSTGT
jgi:hypothetical protein